MRLTSLRIRRFAAIAGAALFLACSGCSTLSRLPPESVDAAAATDPGIAGCPAALADEEPNGNQCRFLVSRDPEAMIGAARLSLRREMDWWARAGHTGPLPPMSMLAISGGGDDGAFSAGLLVGWTESGTRPEFKLVTGISTGALIAPFAFLGPKYDPQLQAVYTEISQRDIFKRRGIIRSLTGDAFADTTPLAKLIEREVTPQMLDEIAQEYARGRVLLVGTSNLDSMEPVIWNMTAIAANRSDPHALELFRKILLASASIPVAFPPVMFDVTAGGEHFQEMHVDGGAESQVFVYPPSLRANDISAEKGFDRGRTLYLIRNARLDNEQITVNRSTLSIASRAVSATLQSQGIGDLFRIYYTAQRDGVGYNLAYIPASFTVKRTTGQFDTAYMRSLFNYAREKARAGYPWDKQPPGLSGPVRAAAAHGRVRATALR